MFQKLGSAIQNSTFSIYHCMILYIPAFSQLASWFSSVTTEPKRIGTTSRAAAAAKRNQSWQREEVTPKKCRGHKWNERNFDSIPPPMAPIHHKRIERSTQTLKTRWHAQIHFEQLLKKTCFLQYNLSFGIMVAYNNYSRKPVCLSALRPVTPKTMPATGNERWRFNVSVEGDTHQMKKALPGPSLMSIYWKFQVDV